MTHTDRHTHRHTDTQTHRHTHTLASIATYSVKMTEYEKENRSIVGIWRFFYIRSGSLDLRLVYPSCLLPTVISFKTFVLNDVIVRMTNISSLFSVLKRLQNIAQYLAQQIL